MIGAKQTDYVTVCNARAMGRRSRGFGSYALSGKFVVAAAFTRRGRVKNLTPTAVSATTTASATARNATPDRCVLPLATSTVASSTVSDPALVSASPKLIAVGV